MIAAALLLSGGTSRAESFRKQSSLMLNGGNEAGFTLGDLLQLQIWQIVTHPLTTSPLDQVNEAVHKPPQRGLQFELLTPGDFGATVHYRW